MNDDVKALIAEARQAHIESVYAAPGKAVGLLNALADALEAATVAPAVDREALVWQMYDLLGGDTSLGSPFMPDEGIAHNARSVSEALLASGLLRERTAPAVDREALARELAPHDDHPESAAWTHLDWAYDVADALLASGILRDVRDVQAEALEQAADVCERIQNDEEFGGSGANRIVAAKIVLRSMAQEARND